MTPFQEIYDCFFSKVDEDFTNKEGQVFNVFKSAIARSYKTIRHKLDYVLDDPIKDEEAGELIQTYSGHFIEKLDIDEIELLALWMVYEWNRKKQQRLVGKRRTIGTRDFNRIEDLANELKIVEFAMKQTMRDINALKNEFYTYKN